MVHVFQSAGSAAKTSHCYSNTRQIALAALEYAENNDDHLPSSTHWGDLVKPANRYENIKTVFRCPAVSDPNGYGYAMIDKASNLSTSKILDAPAFILYFESSDLRWNAHSPTLNFPTHARHGWGNTVAYADGHVNGHVHRDPDSPSITISF